MSAPTAAPKSRPFVLAFLAMAVSTAVILAMPPSAHGMYDPKHGRWLQRDPLGVTPDNTSAIHPKEQYRDGSSLYQYARSRPPVFADPTGRTVFTMSILACEISVDRAKRSDTMVTGLIRGIERRQETTLGCYVPEIFCEHPCHERCLSGEYLAWLHSLEAPVIPYRSIHICSGQDYQGIVTSLRHELARVYYRCDRWPTEDPSCEEAASELVFALVVNGVCGPPPSVCPELCDIAEDYCRREGTTLQACEYDFLECERQVKGKLANFGLDCPE